MGETTTRDEEAARERARARLDRLAVAREEIEALREWAETPEEERGPRPPTPALDAMNARFERKQARLAVAVEREREASVRRRSRS